LREPALVAEHLASVAGIVICVSTSVRLPGIGVSFNSSTNGPFIARPSVHHCEPLQLLAFRDPFDIEFVRTDARCLQLHPTADESITAR